MLDDLKPAKLCKYLVAAGAVSATFAIAARAALEGDLQTIVSTACGALSFGLFLGGGAGLVSDKYIFTLDVKAVKASNYNKDH